MPEEIHFTSQDGVRNLVSVWQGNQDAPLYIILPAMGVPARKYADLALAVNHTGASVATVDLRGIGHSSVRAKRGSDFGYHEIITQDIPALLQALEGQTKDRQIIFVGHSLGGQLASLFLSQKPNLAHGLVLCASCTVDFRGWAFPSNLGLLLMTQLSLLITQVFGYFPGHTLGFGGREAKTVISDWAQNARSGKYRLRNSDIDYDAALKSVKLPVLAINFKQDTFAPLTATQRLLNKFGSRSTSYVALNAKDLELQQADHFSWLRAPKPIAKQISRWYQQTLA